MRKTKILCGCTYKPSVSFHMCHTLSKTAVTEVGSQQDFTTQFLRNEHETNIWDPLDISLKQT